MGIIKTKGIVLMENNTGDYDKMVTLLTPDLGKIGAIAKGSRRPKSALMSGTQFLAFSDFIIYSSPSSYSINSCEPIEIFYNIRCDLEKLNYASFLSRIIFDVTDENQYSYKIIRLLLNTLYLISETDKDLDFILAVFNLKLMQILGFTPHISDCTICNKKDNIKYFSIANHGFVCLDCGKKDQSTISIKKDTFEAIKFIFSNDIKKIFSFEISEEGKKELSLISTLYLNNTLDKNYKLEKY